MSQITREINKITGTIIGISGKLIIYALLVLLLVEGVSKGYQFGHEVFYATAVEEAPGRTVTVTIEEDASVSEVAGDLRRLGLIENQYAFIIQKYFYDYNVNPGTYELNTSMTSKVMLDIMDEEPVETLEETPAPPSQAVDIIEELPEDMEGGGQDEADDSAVEVAP